MIKKRSLVGKIYSMVSYTNRIIALNVILFFVFYILTIFRPELGRYIFLYPEDIIHGRKLWTLITSMFMHGNAIHLFVNMFSLYFLGNFSEQIIGRKRFLSLYFISGILGGLLYVGGAFIGSNIPSLANVLGTLDVPAVGASGALFGLLGLLVILIPRFKVYLVAGPIIVIIISFIATAVLPGTLGNVVGTVASIVSLIMIFAMFSSNPKLRRFSVPIGMEMWIAPIAAIVPLVLVSFFVALPIGNTAHLGGLIAGLIFGIVLRFKYPKKVNLLQRLLLRRVQ